MVNKTKNTYDNALSLTSQFSFCGLPFRLDTYSGCSFSCAYCFARIRGGNINTKKIKVSDPNIIINKFKNAIENGSNSGLVSEFIRRKVPLHFGGMSDPFQPIEAKYSISYDILKYLNEINYPVIISTKSNLVKDDKYLELLSEFKFLLIQFSFSTLNEKVAKVLEPNVESPIKLLETINILSTNKINTSIRWQPFIPLISEDPEDFIDKVKGIGINHLGFEHLKLPIEKNSTIKDKVLKIANFDIYEYYKKNGATNDGRELILPVDFKLKNINRINDILKKDTNITLGVADNELQYLSDTNCCCSGADKFEGFENWSKSQISYAIKKSYQNGMKDIYYDSISSEWTPKGSIDKYINSNSRIVKNSTHNKMEDYIIERWNDLNSSFNPTKYYNVEFKGNYDEKGNKIYNFIEK